MTTVHTKGLERDFSSYQAAKIKEVNDGTMTNISVAGKASNLIQPLSLLRMSGTGKFPAKADDDSCDLHTRSIGVGD